MSKTFFAAGLLAVLLSTSANAETLIRVGHGAQSGHPTHLGLLRLAELVAERTDGEVRIEVFADRQLGEEREMVEGLQLGTVDMTVVSTGPLNAFVPEIAVLDLPFLFRDSAHAYAVLDGAVGQEILGKFENVGIVGLGFFENGWRHLTTKGPVDARDDLQGLKLRTMQNPVHMAAFEAMGASPVPMAWGEVFTSLGQGVIDAQENPITVIYTNSLWEVQSHVTLTGHVYGPHVVLASQMVWEGLPEVARTAIIEAMPEVIAFQRSESARLEAEQIELLRAQGMSVSPIDTTPFREAAAGVYGEFADRFDPAMLAAIQAQ
jgi:tripartite ATP-independent transporter DctP family solute receptor